MIPLALFLRNPSSIEVSAHRARVYAVCNAVSKELYERVGRPMSEEARRGQTAGYAKLLAPLLDHVDFDARGDREARVKELLYAAMGRLLAADRSAEPHPIELLANAAYCLAYPGGIDLLHTFRLPSLVVIGGTGGGFARAVGLVDEWTSDIECWLEWRRALDRVEVRVRAGNAAQLERDLIRRAVDDPDRPRENSGTSYYMKCMRDGDAGRARWAGFRRWLAECRAAVVVPRVNEDVAR